eukprot:CAMPEP_0194487876 /NCGR_PEP_ID=MMETSP0253-20130528/8017_1 /TAXON_ID=2966 /ORGANISM="Noctiluca scintillans" /LENGTH=46 /DNA_ID= /DNA_START= /DNA_END= /DNA_ORIENTATION=
MTSGKEDGVELRNGNVSELLRMAHLSECRAVVHKFLRWFREEVATD